MQWQHLTDINQLTNIMSESIKQSATEQTVLLFKHSTRCSISSMALNRLESRWNEQQTINIIPYYLDLLNHRDISNEITAMFNVEHASPQVLLIKNGKCIYNASHSEISYKDILEATAK